MTTLAELATKVKRRYERNAVSNDATDTVILEALNYSLQEIYDTLGDHCFFLRHITSITPVPDSNGVITLDSSIKRLLRLEHPSYPSQPIDWTGIGYDHVLGYRFNYDGGTTGWVVGETLTFTSPAGTAELLEITDNGTTGEIIIGEMLTGTKPTNNSTVDGAVGNGDVSGTVYDHYVDHLQIVLNMSISGTLNAHYMDVPENLESTDDTPCPKQYDELTVLLACKRLAEAAGNADQVGLYSAEVARRWQPLKREAMRYDRHRQEAFWTSPHQKYCPWEF